MNNLDKIARFEEAINSAAQAEIDSLLTSAKEKADEALACADDKYLEESYREVSLEAKNIKARIAHSVSQKSFETKKELFAYRNSRIEEFFGEMEKEIRDYTNTPDYAKNLSEILSAADKEKAFGKDAIIFVRSEDVKKAKELYPSLTVKKDGNIKLGGATVFYPSESVYLDRTFDNAFDRQKTEFVNNSFMQL